MLPILVICNSKELCFAIAKAGGERNEPSITERERYPLTNCIRNLYPQFASAICGRYIIIYKADI